MKKNPLKSMTIRFENFGYSISFFWQEKKVKKILKQYSISTWVKSQKFKILLEKSKKFSSCNPASEKVKRCQIFSFLSV